MVEKKKRLTLTGNKMPERIYTKLEKLGDDRKLTPYIVTLIEKEEMMDKLISSLSIIPEILSKIENIERSMQQPGVYWKPSSNSLEQKELQQGQLNVSNDVQGEIEEDIKDYDF